MGITNAIVKYLKPSGVNYSIYASPTKSHTGFYTYENRRVWAFTPEAILPLCKLREESMAT
jgi:hypothetical protein